MKCAIAEICSGCDWISKPYVTQIDDKRADLAKRLKDFPVRQIRESGLRDRVDLVLRDGILGLYAKGKKEVVDLGECPQMSDALRAWYLDFKKDLPNVKLGSIRLRVSPSGKRGAWLDFSNVDIKALLDEKTWLEKLQTKAVVEIGQKRKRIRQKETQLGLGEAELENWFQTYLNGEARPLYSTVGAFTQTGFDANRVLVDEFCKMLPKDLAGSWLELGCGIGNFTLPLAHAGATVIAMELDSAALQGAKRAAEESGLVDKIKFEERNFLTLPTEALLGFTGLVADPPRSGLQGFLKTLEQIEKAERPTYVVYVSCYPESFLADAEKLKELGYELEEMVGVDQFTQTSHLETISRFKKI